MKHVSRPWLETLIITAVAIVVWGAIWLSGNEVDRALRSHLLPGRIPSCRITSAKHSYCLLFDGDRTFLADGNFQPIGRVRATEANDIRRALSTSKILRRVSKAEWDDAGEAAYGLDTPMRLEVPGLRTIDLGTVGSEHGYARDGSDILVISPDPAAVLNRSPQVLRDSAMALPDTVRFIRHSAGWRLQRGQGRWQLFTGTADTAGAWADDNLIGTWLSQLDQATPVAFARDPEMQPRIRIDITGTDKGEPATISLFDYGRAPGGNGRLLARQQRWGGNELTEFIIYDLPGEFLEPQPAAFFNRRLLPLDPTTADRVRIGRLLLTRSGKVWKAAVVGAGVISDADANAIAAFLRDLATLERTKGTHERSTSPLVQIWRGELEFTLVDRDPALTKRLAQFNLHDLRSRQLMPELEPEKVLGLVIQPKDELPEFYNRKVGERWAGEHAAKIEVLLERLAAAEAKVWTATIDPKAAPKLIYDCTFIVTDSDKRTFTLRMMADGRIGIPERGLEGVLTDRSRRAIVDGDE